MQGEFDAHAFAPRARLQHADVGTTLRRELVIALCTSARVLTHEFAPSEFVVVLAIRDQDETDCR
jgi:hypothetical protein